MSARLGKNQVSSVYEHCSSLVCSLHMSLCVIGIIAVAQAEVDDNNGSVVCIECGNGDVVEFQPVLEI